MVDEEGCDLVLLVGRNIANRRKQLDIRQDQLAEFIGVESETISRFERAVHAPALKTVEKLARALGTTPDVLLRDEALPPPDDALVMHSYLLGLSAENKAFVIRTVRELAEHLRQLQSRSD